MHASHYHRQGDHSATWYAAYHRDTFQHSMALAFITRIVPKEEWWHDPLCGIDDNHCTSQRKQQFLVFKTAACCYEATGCK